MAMPFTGDKKLPMTSILAQHERVFIDWLTPRLPACIETWHLTLMTIPWSVGLVAFGYLAGQRQDLWWLWLSSLMIFLQWFTDAFDGAVGRYKKTGLVKWGFFMDHFLDYIFMVSILVGYGFLFEGTPREMVFLLIPVFGAFMVSSYLAFGATGQFKITYLRTGPTEVRLGFIFLNTTMIFFGTGWLSRALPYILAASLVLLCVTVYRSQKYIWKLDMLAKAVAAVP